jgi:dynein heavy chain, axonemal
LSALETEIKEIQVLMPLIRALGQKAMLDKHWQRIFDEIGMNRHGALQLGVHLREIISHMPKEGGVYQQKLEAIEVISGHAAGEKNIRDTMATVEAHWKVTEFCVANYRDSKDRFIIKQVEEVITLIEDDSMVVGTSKFVVEIRDDVELWEKKLGYLGFLIDEWTNFQRTWMYLENIFNAADIQA